MSRAQNINTDIQYLNSCLTELDNRLGRAGPFWGPVPVSAFTRMDLALVLLAAAAEDPLRSAFKDTRLKLQQILHSLTSVTERCDPELDPVWRLLADFFEDLLEMLDQGVSLSELATDPRWRGLADRLLRIPGPLGVMDRLDEEMTLWVSRWGQKELLPDAEDELSARWDRVRAYGDHLFSKGLLDGFSPQRAKKH